MASLETKVPPVVVFAVSAIAMFVLSRIASGLAVSIPGRQIVLLLFLVIGGAIAIAAVVAFRRHQTTVNPMQPSASTHLVTGGAFSISRNPMYLGLLMALIGLAAFLANLAAFLVLPIFVAYMTQFQIKPEESAMLENYGQQYVEYMTNVRRWI